MRRAVLALGVVLLLAGCAGADVEQLPTSGEGVAAGSYGGAFPPDGQCNALPTDPEDSHAVGFGGATVRPDGDALVLDGVQTSEGWTHTVDTEEPTEVGITFTGDGRSLVLEVHLQDDGQPRAEVCASDD